MTGVNPDRSAVSGLKYHSDGIRGTSIEIRWFDRRHKSVVSTRLTLPAVAVWKVCRKECVFAEANILKRYSLEDSRPA